MLLTVFFCEFKVKIHNRRAKVTKIRSKNGQKRKKGKKDIDKKEMRC